MNSFCVLRAGGSHSRLLCFVWGCRGNNISSLLYCKFSREMLKKVVKTTDDVVLKKSDDIAQSVNGGDIKVGDIMEVI